MDARSRLALSLAVGIVVSVPFFFLIEWYVAVLLLWDVAALVLITSVMASTWRADPERTREHAMREDDTRLGADLVLIASSVSSLIDVAFVLARAAHTSGAFHGILLTIAIASVVIGWSTVHTLFTLRYARIWYQDSDGISWHDNDVPAFIDFAYVAITVGMTFQVSDTDITTKRMRRAVRTHALLSYLFGVVIVAMTINIVASLLTQ